MSNLKALIDEHGESSEKIIFDLVYRKSLDFQDWLANQPELSPVMQNLHLQNVYLFLTLLVETPPFIFPEEVEDDEGEFDKEDDERLLGNEGSTVSAFKYFVYNLYPRRGPLAGDVADNLLNSIGLYYSCLLETNVILQMPHAVDDVLNEPSTFKDRLDSYHKFDLEFANDPQSWSAAFEDWMSEYYDL